MSPHAANSLVHDLVQMAQAMEQLPEVRQELERTQSEVSRAHDTIQRLELKLIDYKTSIDELNNNVRKAEADRDDAELRFLEAEERTTKALAFIKEQFGSAGALIQALEPAKVVVKTEPEVKVESASPLPVSTEDHSQNVHSSTEHTVADTTSAQGQSEPLPTASLTRDQSAPTAPHSAPAVTELTPPIGVETDAITQTDQTPSVPSPVPASASSENATPEVAEEHGPYFGKRYYDHPIYVNFIAWLNGGGTEEDYNWRPRSNAF